MFRYTVWESRGVFYFYSRFLCFKQAIKNRIYSKIPCPQSPSFLARKPRRLREAKRALGTINGHCHMKWRSNPSPGYFVQCFFSSAVQIQDDEHTGETPRLSFHFLGAPAIANLNHVSAKRPWVRSLRGKRSRAKCYMSCGSEDSGYEVALC